MVSLDARLGITARLLAGRFWKVDDRAPVDLASGRRVRWRVRPRVSGRAQLEWEVRCHHALQTPGATRAILVDYGLTEASQRFEAWDRDAVSCRHRGSSDPAGIPADCLDDLLEARVASGPRAVRFAVTPDLTATPAGRALVRHIRLRGYVPMASHVLRRWPQVEILLEGAHVVVFDLMSTEAPMSPQSLSWWILRAGVSGPQPHVVVMSRRDSGTCPPAPGAVRAWRVHETPTSYGEARLASVPCDQVIARSVAEAQAAEARGRHAAALRAWRVVIEAARRRREWVRAADAGCELGRLLLTRGRSSDALALFAEAREWAERAGALRPALRAVVWLAMARVDEGALAEGEAAARAALMVANESRDAEARAAASLTLARGLIWQWRLDEAEAAVEAATPETAGGRVAALRLASRIALWDGRLADAATRAQLALECASSSGQVRLVAAARAAIAAVEAELGQIEALTASVRSGLSSARLARAPLLALRLRLAWIEGLMAANRVAEARAAARQLAARRLRCLPPLLGAQVRRTLAVALRDGVDTAVEHFASASQARALAMRDGHAFVPVRDVIDLLQVCQEADDEERAVSRLCAGLRDRLGAAAVAVFDANGAAALPGSLGRWSRRPAAVDRALQTGLIVPMASCDTGVEAAAPIRSGGATVAALTCRWPADAAVRRDRVRALLLAASAAVAPCVAVVLARRRTTLPAGSTALDLLGVGSAIEGIRRAVALAGPVPYPVLIEGESGSGKELVARAVHRLSARRDRHFHAVNCAAFTDDLLEAELFGHVRGAFTGATSDRTGLFEASHGGTLFLDEVGELSGRAQAKLLRVLQEGELRRIGENLARSVDVRVIAASNRSLDAEVSVARFRRDLFYRLAVIRIVVPPLRDRPEDIPLLADHFWKGALERTGGAAVLDRGTVAALARYDWPGNVRELQNVMAALAVSAPARGRVDVRHLPSAIAGATTTGAGTLGEARQMFERRFVRAALARAGGHLGRAATDLGLTRQGLAKLLRRLSIDDVVADAG